ncbi:hypothetical protein Leryth_004374, partial [Lithospermum erythrorhizon]
MVDYWSTEKKKNAMVDYWSTMKRRRLKRKKSSYNESVSCVYLWKKKLPLTNRLIRNRQKRINNNIKSIIVGEEEEYVRSHMYNFTFLFFPIHSPYSRRLISSSSFYSSLFFFRFHPLTTSSKCHRKETASVLYRRLHQCNSCHMLSLWGKDCAITRGMCARVKNGNGKEDLAYVYDDRSRKEGSSTYYNQPEIGEPFSNNGGRNRETHITN